MRDYSYSDVIELVPDKDAGSMFLSWQLSLYKRKVALHYLAHLRGRPEYTDITAMSELTFL
ncbi:MAG: hypothetical protein QM632_03165 [Micrococcaceae bacterium]